MSVSPSSETITQQSGNEGVAEYTLTVTPINGFTGGVLINLADDGNAISRSSVTSQQSGNTWTLDIPGTVFTPGTHSLTFTVSTGTYDGTNADAGGCVSQCSSNSSAITHPQTATLVVNTSSGSNPIAMVQASAVEGNSVTSLSRAFQNSNTAGNMIIAFVRMSTASQSVTVSDSNGNVYTDAVAQAQTTDGHQIHIFYAANIKGGPNTVTASFSNVNNYPWLAIYEYGGLRATSPLDQVVHAQGYGTAVNTGATGSTTAANELVFSAASIPAGSSTQVSAGSGFTIMQQDTVTSRAANEVDPVVAIGSYSGTFTLSAPENWAAVAATFVGASSTSSTGTSGSGSSGNITTPELIQSAAVQGSGTTSVSQSFSTANTAGNLIIAFVRMSTSSQTVQVSDSNGNVYSDAVSQAQTTDGHQIHIFYATNIKGGANTITATFSGVNNYPWLAIYEYSGVHSLDTTAHAQGSGSTASSGATAAAAGSGELVFAGLGVPNDSSVSVTAESGWKMELQDTIQYGSRAATEDTIGTTAGPFSGTFTLSGSANWCAVVAVFKP